jgi:hypothetical protein
MAYEMLTHRLPFTGESLFDIGMKQLVGTVDMTGVPDALADTIRRAIAYDKMARPASAVAFAEEISAVTRNS